MIRCAITSSKSKSFDYASLEILCSNRAHASLERMKHVAYYMDPDAIFPQGETIHHYICPKCHSKVIIVEK